ncbi:MAG: TRC40/GET3/ArsA family transport-energizing ATPase, partial [Gemmatimonadota bacterium]
MLFCGPGVDPALLQLARDLRWLTAQGVTVQRVGLAQEPQRFVGNPRVSALMHEFGDQALPAVLVNDSILAQGRYPSRQELIEALAPTTLTPSTLTPMPTGPSWLAQSTRFLFFTGKGGVGKTTIASASALQLAESGQRTLLVSTDPASNLDDVFAMRAESVPTPVPTVPALWIMNIDPVAAAAAYREKMVAPYRGLLPDAAVRGMEEQFSGACTVEIAAFNEFTALLADPALVARFDHILFDTAPTGHTLRLLSLPTAWSSFLTTSSNGASCLGPLAGLAEHQAQYQLTVAALADSAQTTVLLVSRAEVSALREAARAGGELAALGIAQQQLVVNGLLPEDVPTTDPTATAYISRQRNALAQLPSALQALPIATIPLVAHDLTGLAALRALVTPPHAPHADEAGASELADATAGFGSFDGLAEAVAADGRGVVMTMGKGGVGKTTVAA